MYASSYPRRNSLPVAVSAGVETASTAPIFNLFVGRYLDRARVDELEVAIIPLDQLLLRAVLENLDVDRLQAEEAVDVDELLLAVPTRSSDGLRLGRVVMVL
jgi:uncharacterized protein (DUF4213/DUF364 family)